MNQPDLLAALTMSLAADAPDVAILNQLVAQLAPGSLPSDLFDQLLAAYAHPTNDVPFSFAILSQLNLARARTAA